jgi:hypothetical protein
LYSAAVLPNPLTPGTYIGAGGAFRLMLDGDSYDDDFMNELRLKKVWNQGNGKRQVFQIGYYFSNTNLKPTTYSYSHFVNPQDPYNLQLINGIIPGRLAVSPGATIPLNITIANASASPQRGGITRRGRYNEQVNAIFAGHEVKFNDKLTVNIGARYDWLNMDLRETKAPFDIILLHDVLDHAVLLDPVQILMQAASVLSDNGRIYVRNHTWCSRHGSHLYLYKNLAFLHLVFDEIELVRCEGLQLEPNIKVNNPVETYRSWFGKANLEVKSEFIIRSEVEEFFTKTALINERIQKNWTDPATAKSNMEIDFIEYILEPSKESANRQIF